MTYKFIKDLIFLLDHKEEITEIINNEDFRLPDGMNPNTTEVIFKIPISGEKIPGSLLNVSKYECKTDNWRIVKEVTFNVQATDAYKKKI